MDTDAYNEIDDQFAITYMMKSKDKLNVKAILAAPFYNENSTSPKDGMEKSYEEIQKLLDMMKEGEIKEKVFRRAENYLKDEVTPVISDAAKYLAELADSYTAEKPLYVVGIGAITNIASAILINPKIIDKIVIVWLGGHSREYKDTAEFNMQQDIAAARVVFNSGAPLIQLPCRGVVSTFSISKQELEFWLEGKNDICDYLVKHTVDAVSTYKDGVKAVKDDCDYIDYYTQITGLDASTVNKTGYFSIGTCASGNAEYGTAAFGDFTVTTTEMLKENTIYVKDSVSYEDEGILINLNFEEVKTTKDISVEDITKDNIFMQCGRKNVDYTLTPVIENGKVTGVKISLKNDFASDRNYDVKVKIGDNCNFEGVYNIPAPIKAENMLLKDSDGNIVDRISDVTDGKIIFTGEIKNNTYKPNKQVKIITAIYNDNRLYDVNIVDADIEIGNKYILNKEMSVPAEGLDEKWSAAAYVWENDVITSLLCKQAKTYGIDSIKDTKKDITAAFIGGSITQGKNYTDPFIEKWQADREGKITLINAGVGGTDTRYGTMRLYEDVLSENPDIVFVEFTLNDLGLSESVIKKNVESMIRQAYNMPHQPVISFIYIPDRRTESDGSYKIAKNISYYDDVMNYYGLKGFNAQQLVLDAIDAGEMWDDFVSAGNVHPDALQGEKIAALMYNEFKTNAEDYIKNICWNPTKGFGADDYDKPIAISSDAMSYDGSWTKDAVGDVVTEGYGLPAKLPFKNFYASETSGAKATFKFFGTKLIISSLMGKLGRNAVYTIRNKDGIIEKSGELNNYISGYDWYENVILFADKLENTEHTLEITVGNGTGLFGIGELWVDE